MKLTGETSFFITVLFVSFLLVFIGVFLFSSESQYSEKDLITPFTATKGIPGVAITLVEFSDFQCPACKAALPYVEEALLQYSGKMHFGYRHFPLSIHTYSFDAAVSAEAAKEQGKFWEMHDYLFKHQSNFSDKTIFEGAKEIGLNMDVFEKAVKDNKLKDRVRNDISDGKRFGVNGTPTFFLNGKKLTLASFSDLSTIVKQELRKVTKE